MSVESSVDVLVRGFGRLLDVAWAGVTEAARYSQTGSFVDDWLQANWEMFVEAGLGPGVLLEVYGQGADCNERSSRVYRPIAAATHSVVCCPLPGATSIEDLLVGGGARVEVDGAGLPMEELVSLDGTWFARRPPFDCVLIELDGHSHVFRLDTVVFRLGPALRG